MKNWNSENLIKIRKALLWVYAKKEGIIANHSDGVENLMVIKDKNIISLHFMDTTVFLLKSKVSDSMSSIDISQPLNLLGKYAQVMMLSLVFKPQPKNLYMLGFGGGRVPMIFHHYFPKLLIEASEVSEGVIQLAEICFGVVPDERMKISLQDGRKHLATFPQKHFDIILLDSFSGIGEHPNHLSTQEFYQLCQSRLTDDGVAVTNLVDNNPYFKQKVATFCATFKFTYQYKYKKTYLFFGSDVNNFNQDEFKLKAKKIATQYEFEFPYTENSDYITACYAEDFSAQILLDKSLFA
ncbi:MAG: fused MFS/spermidine synthase [Cocleimonas sp.]|nr:fused MFS/spermidine synthase [Cocleimonas sp.]